MSSSESRLPSDIKRNHFLNAIDRLNYFLGVFVGGTIYLLLAVIVFIGVAARYIFREPFSWNLDMSVVLLVTGTMLAFGYALQVKAHVSVESFIMRLSPGKQKVMAVIISSICLIVYIGFVAAAWDTFSYAFRMGGYYGDIKVPMALVKVFIPIGFIALLLQGVATLIRDIANLKSVSVPQSVK